MAKMKNPGKFLRRIQLQKQISTPVRGGRDIAWQDYGEVIFAEVKEERRYFIQTNGAKKTNIETVFKVRYDHYLFDQKPPEMRVQYDGKPYRVTRLENIDTNFRFMNIYTDGIAWELLPPVE
jgi:SPP1 family predicted phage head-tail adaptor